MKSLIESKGLEKQNSIINIFKGILISFLSTLLLLFVFSIVLTYSNIAETTITPIIIIITIISILIGSSVVTRKIKKNGIIYGGIIGTLYIVSIYIISSIIETGFSLNTSSIIMIILSILAGMLGGIIGVNAKK